MLDGRGDDVRSAARRGEVRALDGKVIRFAAAACKHDLIGRRAEQFRDLLTRPLQCGFRRRTGPMAAGGIAERLIQEWTHGLRHGWINRCARVVIEIDRHRRSHAPC